MLATALVLATVAATTRAHGVHPGDEADGLAALFRQVFAGSETRNFVQRWFMADLPDMAIGTQSPVTTRPDGTKEQTFVTSPMTLAQGEIVNKWIPIAWPKGHIAVKTFNADVVKANSDGSMPPVTACCDGPNVAPRREVFMHHWTVQKWQLPASAFKKLVETCGRPYDLEFSWKHALQTLLSDAGMNDGANGPCRQAELHLFFGIGNEVRGKPKTLNNSYEFPDPYAIEFDSNRMKKQGEFMLLNTHLIDIRNVTDVRKCAECDCEYLGVTPKDHEYVGGLGCCHSTGFDGGQCPVSKATTTKSNQTYHIRYTITWRDFDSTVKPLEVITFDATDNNSHWSDISWLQGGYKEEHTALHQDSLSTATVNDGRSGEMPGGAACHVEYYVPSCTLGDRCIHTMRNSWKVPWPIDIVFVRSHFHAGGQNMTVRSDTSNICTGVSTYDDDNFLIDVTGCKAGTDRLPRPVHLNRADRLYVESVYKQDQKPHYGVMAMSFVYAHITSPSLGAGVQYV
jgi:hypothetical protein